MIPPIAATYSKFLAVHLTGAAVFVVQRMAGLTTMELSLMIALAAMVHLTNMTLRDAEIRGLAKAYGLNAKDVIAYSTSVAFDTYLLFGLISGAGLVLPWTQFLTLSLIALALLPIVIFLNIRTSYRANGGALNSGHLLGPLLFAVLLASAFFTDGMQMHEGNQNYVWLVLLSSVFASILPGVKFAGPAQVALIGSRFCMLGLLIWNYLNIA